ncbi:hypothetical protein FS842_006066 [Serendipita sp. 407]|nr:hypothetical protein FS842_006066 [Serendipita sp. 407]
MDQESPLFRIFRTWLVEQGAYIHPSIYFASGSGSFGNAVYTKDALDGGNTKLVSCPFSLIITSKTAREALGRFVGSSEESPLNDNETLCTYLMLHICLGGIRDRSLAIESLVHGPYVAILPREILTPIFFSEQEFELLRGTNLYLSTLERKEGWRHSWKRCQTWINLPEDVFTMDLFMLAQTWISSRAFPSSLMDDSPSLSSSNSVQILVPLVDSLNHARGAPVSWSVDDNGPQQKHKSKSLSIVSHYAAEKNKELFNNYGAKPNDELMLGYGFTLANNPEDGLSLKLPGGERRYRISRKAGSGVRGSEEEAVWNEIGRRLQEGFAMDTDDLDVMMVELEMEIGQVLPEMISDLRSRLPTIVDPTMRQLEAVRPQVQSMIYHYVQGQYDILDDLMAFARRRLKVAMEKAEQLGIDITLESGEEEEEEEDR